MLFLIAIRDSASLLSFFCLVRLSLEHLFICIYLRFIFITVIDLFANSFVGKQLFLFSQKGVQVSANVSTTNQDKSDDSIVSDIVKARQIIQLSLASVSKR